VFKFITHRSFWLNLLIVLLLTVLMVWGVFQMLGIITKHGEYLTVPNVIKNNTIASTKLLEEKGFTVVIQDSVYTDTAKMGTVLKQFPEANSTVKVNRVVLLTVNRVTLPLVDMPTLTSKSKDYAIEVLERSHLKLGDTIYKPSYMLGAVINQQINGIEIAPGAKVPWGSKVDLVIGEGLSDVPFFVPDLRGMTYAQAKAIILEKNLQLASTIAEPGTRDTANAYVYKQNPPRFNEDKSPNSIRAGQVMDLWISPIMKAVVEDSTTLNESLESLDKDKKEGDKKDDDKKEGDKKVKTRVVAGSASKTAK
jgi:eukaryotic-like serine/threonine-protein kinase